MKIVDRKTFLLMPADTLYSEFRPHIFGPLMIKGKTIGEDDWAEQRIADAVEAYDCGEFGLILEESMLTGSSFRLDLNFQGRNGCFDGDEVLFAVWEKRDLKQLIARLKDCLH